MLATYLKGDKVEPRVFIKHIIIDSGQRGLQAAEGVGRISLKRVYARLSTRYGVSAASDGRGTVIALNSWR